MAGYSGSDKAIQFLYDQIMQYSEIPAASIEMEGKVIQYTGETNGKFSNGYFYRCVNNLNNSYVWVRVDTQPSNETYTLPTASENVLGGVKIGDNIGIDDQGHLFVVPYMLPIASKNVLGGVKIGDNINIDNQGHISVDSPVKYTAVSESNIGEITTEIEVASFAFYPNGDTTFVLNGSISGEVTTQTNCVVTIKIKLDSSDYLTFKQTCVAGYVTIPVNCGINVQNIGNHIIQVTVSTTNGSITL